MQRLVNATLLTKQANTKPISRVDFLDLSQCAFLRRAFIKLSSRLRA